MKTDVMEMLKLESIADRTRIDKFSNLNSKMEDRTGVLHPVVSWKLWGFLFFVLFLSTNFLIAETEVEGEISGVWNREESPYVVTDSLWVLEEDSLVIEPGVDVFVNAEVDIQILGVLFAQGTEDDSIRIINHNEDETWGALHLGSNNKENRFSWCRISGCDTSDLHHDIDSFFSLKHVYSPLWV